MKYQKYMKASRKIFVGRCIFFIRNIILNIIERKLFDPDVIVSELEGL